MQSRKNLRKVNNRNNLYLVIAGIVVILAIIAGVTIHNNHVRGQAKARAFATSHFNPNVTIYGVKVGKLTVKKATEKINKTANNVVLLDNKKIVLKHDSQVQTISQKQVQDYFNRQHTSMPSNQTYNYNSNEFTTAKKKLTSLKDAKVVFKVDGHNYDLKADNLIDKISWRNGKYQFDNIEKLKNRIRQINKELSTLHKSYKISVPSGTKVNGKEITVTNKSYGWGIYEQKAIQKIKDAFINNQASVDGSQALYGLGYSTYAHGYNKSNKGIGDNYVVVSIKNQELWIVRNGKVAVHLTDIVTGTYTGGTGNRTPTGVWYIQYKESPSILRGNNDDGSKYASKVQYWMPFTLSGCGLHDASWRTDWSKTAYLKGGSHGCVNIRPSEISNVWQHVIKDEPVIVYN